MTCQVGIEAEDCFEKANSYFKKISHLRGIALANKHMRNFVIYQLEQATAEHNERHKDHDHEHTEENHWTQGQAEKQKLINDLDSNYHMNIANFRTQAEQSRDRCITRRHGDDFSLLTEIVKSCDNKPLFEKKDNLTQKLGFRFYQQQL